MAKKLNTDLDKSKKKKAKDDDIDLNDITVDEDLPAEEGEEDMTAYQMGNILISDGSADEVDSDVQQLMSAVKSKKGDDDDDDDEDTGDVWVNDFDVFDATDPYLEGENYDPDNVDYDE